MSNSGGGVALAVPAPALVMHSAPQTTAKKADAPAATKASKKSQKGASKEPSTAKQAKSKAAKADAKSDTNADTPPKAGGAKKGSNASATDAASASGSGNAAAADTTSKKHSAKQQLFKITREKERKEKQQKQGAGLAAAAAAVSPTKGGATRETSTTTVHSPLSRLQEMEQDGVKSRNHRLFLAPSSRSTGPCWSGRLARDARAESVADRLHDEILEYAKYTRATVDAMTVHIEQMMTHVRRCVHALWPKSRMEPFGSYSTGIWLPSSDVDLVILGVVEIHDRMLTIKSLRQLAKALEKQSWVESLVVLDTAKIPVLKLVTAESSVPIDITFESTATHSGLLARDLIKRYADEMPELYPLAVVFKQLLRERDLNDAYTGGLSSYSVVLMIIHFQLLWRYGDRCFRAAAAFASGSPLPRPADLIAEEEQEKEKLAREAESTQSAWGKKLDLSDASSTDKSSTASGAATPSITASFAAVVTRSKSLKRPASEAGRTGADDAAKPKPAAPSTPFSYAAVAAGIVKLTPDESAKKAAAPAAPSSYAAAVAAPAQPEKAKALAASRAASTAAKKSSDPDSISVTSSSADTEDSASLSDSRSAHDDDDPHASTTAQPTPEPVQEEETELSLGERTMTILEFFGIIFDYRKNGLSIRDGGYIYRLADHVGASGDLCKKLPALVIEDPIHPDRNVSASSFAFSKVVAVFEDSFYALKYFRPTRFTPSALSCLLSSSGHSLHQYQLQQQLDIRRLTAKSRTSSPVKAAIAAK